MDSRLETRLKRLEGQINFLRQVEEKFFELEAHKKSLAAELFLASKGKNVAEREALAYASQQWKDFAIGLARSESSYNNEKRRYELQLKAYDAEHLTFKIEESAIKRQL